MSTRQEPSERLAQLLQLKHGENKQTFSQLEAQLKSTMGVVPFVGAGLSIPCGMPGWPDFLRNLADGVGRRSQIDRYIQESAFEEAAQMLGEALGDRAFTDRIEQFFGDTALEEHGLYGPILQVPKLARGPVMTTNFDHALERAFEQHDRSFEERVWGAKPDMLARALHMDHRYLIKLHGDVLDRADRILTLNDYQRHYASSDVDKVDLSLPLPRLLEQAFTSRTLLFLGCSLEADRTLRLLHRVARHGAPPAHYAIVELPKTNEEIFARAKFLSDLNIRPLWFPHGEYDAIETLLEALIASTNP